MVKNIEKMGNRTDLAAQRMANEMAALTERVAKEKANTGTHKRGLGHVVGTGPGPNVVTGTLRSSIKYETSRVGFGVYQAIVGPTVIYGRTLELGNPNWTSGAKYPFMRPAFEELRANGGYNEIQERLTKTYLKGL